MGTGIVCMFGVVVLWSFTPLLVKIALRTFDPFTVTLFRLIQGVVFTTVLYRCRGHKLKSLLTFDPWLLIGGAGISLNYIFYVFGFYYTTAGTGGLIMQFQIVIFILLAVIVLHEPIGIPKIVGIVVVITGVSLVFLAQEKPAETFASKFLLGNSLLVVSAVGWGLYGLANKVLSVRRMNLQILIPILSMACVCAAVAASTQFEIKSPVSLEAAVVIAILGILCTGVNFLLLSEGIKRLSASLAGIMISLTPVCNLFLAHWILGEPLVPKTLFGAALIVGGILVIMLQESK